MRLRGAGSSRRFVALLGFWHYPASPSRFRLARHRLRRLTNTLLFCFFLLMSFKRVAKGWRAWMQAFLHPLSQFLLHHMFHALLLVFSGNGHIRIDLSRCWLLDSEWNLVEALEEGIAHKIIIEQH